MCKNVFHAYPNQITRNMKHRHLLLEIMRLSKEITFRLKLMQIIMNCDSLLQINLRSAALHRLPLLPWTLLISQRTQALILELGVRSTMRFGSTGLIEDHSFVKIWLLISLHQNNNIKIKREDFQKLFLIAD